jgi:hypothetical protein
MGVAECAIEPMEAGPSLSPILSLNDGFREGLNPSYGLNSARRYRWRGRVLVNEMIKCTVT